jgi:hypothetical protein
MALVVSSGFRLIFSGIGIIILFALLSTSSLPLFHRTNTFPLLLCLICILASLYLERWIFDRSLDLFERHVGLVFLFRRRQQPLSDLRRVLLSRYQRGYMRQETDTGALGRSFKRRRALSRAFVTLGVEDTKAKMHRLDIARAVHLGEIRKTARGIADFCGIPLEDDAGSEYD